MVKINFDNIRVYDRNVKIGASYDFCRHVLDNQSHYPNYIVCHKREDIQVALARNYSVLIPILPSLLERMHIENIVYHLPRDLDCIIYSFLDDPEFKSYSASIIRNNDEMTVIEDCACYFKDKWPGGRKIEDVVGVMLDLLEISNEGFVRKFSSVVLLKNATQQRMKRLGLIYEDETVAREICHRPIILGLEKWKVIKYWPEMNLNGSDCRIIFSENNIAHIEPLVTCTIDLKDIDAENALRVACFSIDNYMRRL